MPTPPYRMLRIVLRVFSFLVAFWQSTHDLCRQTPHRADLSPAAGRGSFDPAPFPPQGNGRVRAYAQSPLLVGRARSGAQRGGHEAGGEGVVDEGLCPRSGSVRSSSKEKKIVILYISRTLRKAGDMNDPYSIFTQLVMTGRFNQVFAQLGVRIPPKNV